MQFPENREEVEEEAVTPLVTNINSFIRILHDYDIIFLVNSCHLSLLLGICKQSYSN